MFASETGEPVNRHHLSSRRFKALLRRAQLPEIRFHDLRHTCATLLLTKNVNPKIVSEMLGHATIAITSGHLLARTPQHARSGCSSDGRSVVLARWCSNWCTEDPATMAGSSGFSHILVFCRTFISRGGGTRTHTPSQDPDFKSENPRPGASYHVLVCSVGMPKTRLL